MSIWKAPTIRCSICTCEDISFGVGKCPDCQADILYDIKGNLSLRRFMGSFAIIKVGRYFFLGLMGLLALISLLNVFNGETESAMIIALLIGVIGLCVVGMFWLTHFVVTRFKSRGGIKFIKS